MHFSFERCQRMPQTSTRPYGIPDPLAGMGKVSYAESIDGETPWLWMPKILQ